MKDHYLDAIESARLFMRLGNRMKAEAIMNHAKRMQDDDLKNFYLGIITDNLNKLFERHNGNSVYVRNDNELKISKIVARVCELTDEANKIYYKIQQAWKKDKK